MAEDGAAPVGPTWFTVKYGEDQQLPFNSACWAVVLHDHIKATCGYGGQEEEFDLLPEDDLASRANLLAVGKETATGVITPKASYILAKLVKAEDGTESIEQMWTPPEGYEPPVPKNAPPPGKKK